MATVYKIEVTSHWINYSEEYIKHLIENAIQEENNLITVEVERK